MQLAAMVKHRQRGKQNKEIYVNNTNVCINQKRFHSILQYEAQEAVTDPPPVKKVEEYWKKLWSEKPFNEDASRVRAEEKRMENVTEGEWEERTHNDSKRAIRRLSNWKAAGLD